MEQLIKKLDQNLTVLETRTKGDVMEIHVKYEDGKVSCCPKCGAGSVRVHSHYTKCAWDLPIQNYKVKLVFHVTEFFCDNDQCTQKIFSEQFNFLGVTKKRTQRLDDYILNVSKSTSAMQAERFMNENVTKISNDTIMRLIKKNAQNQS